MTYQNIETKIREGIGFLTINRPDVLNVLDIKTLNEITHGMRELEASKDVDVIVLTGAGENAFIGGVDVQSVKEMDKGDAERLVYVGHDTMRVITENEKPVIAMVGGHALGCGVEVVLACDFAYASEGAKFGFPEVGMGIFPAFGGTQRLPRHIGEQRAKELIFTGRMISARDACEWGIINRVTPAAELLTETLKLAREIQTKGQVAVRLAKKSVNKGVDQPLSAGLEIERDTFAECFDTEDRREGIDAFLERRKPTFVGK